eukprot:gb/GFBE01016583.1/.p1 GENE.gb/GFBE01016583.1/~~gb/GFBE01016583.1/.p1  ORF type:complete len:498 (+),score=124.09 gb/GFBE01016583.1/:1-1494(+)
MAAGALSVRRQRSWPSRAVAAAVAAVLALRFAGPLLEPSFVTPGSNQGSPSQKPQTGRSAFDFSPRWDFWQGAERQSSQQDAGSATHKAGVLAVLAALCVAWLAPPVETGQFWPAGPAPAVARTPLATSGSGSKVNKDPISLLQLALPLEETLGENQVKPIREFQKNVEEITGATKIRSWDRAASYVEKALNTLKDRKKELMKPVVASRQADASATLDAIVPELKKILKDLEVGAAAEMGSAREQDMVDAVGNCAAKAQELVGKFEELVVPPDFLPKVPDYAASLPRLNGRATVEWTLKRGPDSGPKSYAIDAVIYPEAKLTMVLDGWSAPVSAGNFLDLVKRDFYKGMKIQRADGFIIQTGDSGDADQHGFRPEKGKPVRRIPLEVGIRGRKEALYSETMDEARLIGQEVKIPFQADGTISMARAEFDDDSASSQVFMFLFESDMTPAGKNFLDGRYGAFGYVVDGAKFLRKIKEGDIIEDIKITSGLENLINASS